MCSLPFSTMAQSLIFLTFKFVFCAQSTANDYIRPGNKLNPSPTYSAYKSLNRCVFVWFLVFIYIISLDTKSKTEHTYTNINHKIFEELFPSILPLLKWHKRLGHTGIVDVSVKLINTRFLKLCIKSTLKFIRLIVSMKVTLLKRYWVTLAGRPGQHWCLQRHT